MKTYNHLYDQLCSWKNLNTAYNKAKEHKTRKPSISEFSKNYVMELALLRYELKNKTYKPRPLKKFILRDPKTRTICVSNFRDRVVHHALINIIQPIFEPRFIYDSFASIKGKGTLPAIKRFDKFKRQVTKNGKRMLTIENDCEKSKSIVKGYVLKADIYHYFETVDHEVLLKIISRLIKDDDVLWLSKIILDNYDSKEQGKGMPLGNWTSQFFANIYLNELDQYTKHELKAKNYIRYEDDFVILHQSKHTLQQYEAQIKQFLTGIKLQLHPTKCSIKPLHCGASFLGFRIYPHHKLVRKRNMYKIQKKLEELLDYYGDNVVDSSRVLDSLQGWSAYAMHANTYRLRVKLREEVTRELALRSKQRKI